MIGECQGCYGDRDVSPGYFLSPSGNLRLGRRVCDACSQAADAQIHAGALESIGSQVEHDLHLIARHVKARQADKYVERYY